MANTTLHGLKWQHKIVDQIRFVDKTFYCCCICVGLIKIKPHIQANFCLVCTPLTSYVVMKLHCVMEKSCFIPPSVISESIDVALLSNSEI